MIGYLPIIIAGSESRRLVLTKEQMGVLDFVRPHRRVAMRGGAGTGKTVLALEKARRLANDGCDRSADEGRRMAKRNPRILVIGAVGQVGTELTPALRKRYGSENVVAAGHRTPPDEAFRDAGPFETVDATDMAALRALVREHDVDVVYHLSTILSGDGEKDPERAWHVNVGSLKNVLDLGVEFGMRQIFWPSSIAVFGPTSPRVDAPQRTVLEPTTMYGVSKVVGENLCNYYFVKHGLDVRGLRYPGLVSYKAFSGGGTTDYSVEIFSAAVERGRYTCFVDAGTMLPLMYMEDAIRATLELMATDASRITVRTSYNVSAVSFTAGDLATEVARRVDGFTCDFEPDFRQAIADSWPDSMDDSVARQDWGWKPEFDLPVLVDTMLDGVREKLARR